ncbi:MAG: hypothetical protein A2Z31_09685 [candidate division NC10 bacterium RBG_16_65_8]|nr:MAG: hypothetical protein A2Z31_09685 [candidate division NC10 bacterium RBG_16_65_8]
MSRSRPDLQNASEITAVLLMVSRLRDLFLQLPHLPTPRERAELTEFSKYQHPDCSLDNASLQAVRTGFREAWRKGDLEAILNVRQRLPKEILRGDLEIQAYVEMASRRAGGSGSR